MANRRGRALFDTVWSSDANAREWARESKFTASGAKIPGAKIVCVECKKSSHFECPGSKPSVEIANAFRSRGWQVGGGLNADKCPDCVSPASRVNTRKIISNAKQVVRLVSSTPKEKTAMLAEKPPEMGVDEVILIMSKLQEVYLGPDKGYTGDWSDKKLAASLGAPSEWVKRIRHKSFGPGLGDNEDVRDLLNASADVLKEAKELRKDCDRIRNEWLRIDERSQSLDRKVEHLQKQADHIRKAVA